MKRSSCGCGATTSGCADSVSAIAISTWMSRAPTLCASPCAKEHSAIVLAPLAIAGLSLFFVPYWLTGIAARLATTRVGCRGLGEGHRRRNHLLRLACGARDGTAWLSSRTNGALIAAVLLPVVAVAALFALERESAVLDAVRAWLLIGRAARTGTRVAATSAVRAGRRARRSVRMAANFAAAVSDRPLLDGPPL